jgi:hypothetical protein
MQWHEAQQGSRIGGELQANDQKQSKSCEFHSALMCCLLGATCACPVQGHQAHQMQPSVELDALKATTGNMHCLKMRLEN